MKFAVAGGGRCGLASEVADSQAGSGSAPAPFFRRGGSLFVYFLETVV